LAETFASLLRQKNRSNGSTRSRAQRGGESSLLSQSSVEFVNPLDVSTSPSPDDSRLNSRASDCSGRLHAEKFHFIVSRLDPTRLDLTRKFLRLEVALRVAEQVESNLRRKLCRISELPSRLPLQVSLNRDSLSTSRGGSCSSRRSRVDKLAETKLSGKVLGSRGRVDVQISEIN
jgi:hypothetical protein